MNLSCSCKLQLPDKSLVAGVLSVSSQVVKWAATELLATPPLQIAIPAVTGMQ